MEKHEVYIPDQLGLSDEYLKHYGVLGMKWGVRRARRISESTHRVNTQLSNPNAYKGYKYKKAGKEYLKGFGRNAVLNGGSLALGVAVGAATQNPLLGATVGKGVFVAGRLANDGYTVYKGVKALSKSSRESFESDSAAKINSNDKKLRAIRDKALAKAQKENDFLLEKSLVEPVELYDRNKYSRMGKISRSLIVANHAGDYVNSNKPERVYSVKSSSKRRLPRKKGAPTIRTSLDYTDGTIQTKYTLE